MTLLGRPVPDPVIFRGPLGAITQRIEPYTDADPIGIHTSVLALLGAAVGRSPHVMFEAYHPLLMWPILLGDTNHGRKGSATNHAIRLFTEAYPRFMKQRVSPSMQASGAAIIAGLVTRAIRLEGPGIEDTDGSFEDDFEEVGEGEDLPQGNDSKRKTFISKPGYRGVILEREMKTFLARSKMDSTMAGTLRQMWEGERVDGETKKEHYALVDPHVSVVCHIPPEEFIRNYSTSDAAGGSMNRMFPVFVHRSKIMKFPKRVTADVMERNVKAIVDMVEFGSQCEELLPTAAAEKLWENEIWDALDSSTTKNKIMKEFAGRAMPYCWRVAGLYAIGRQSKSIGVEDLESAFALIKYMIDTVEYVFQEFGAELLSKGRKSERAPFEGDAQRATPQQVKKLVELAKGAGEEGLKTRMITPRMNVTSDQFQNIGAAAEELGLVERWKVQGPTGAPGYFVVYVGPEEEKPEKLSPPEKPKEKVEAPRPAEPQPVPRPVTTITKPLPSPVPKQAAPRKEVVRVNGSSSSDDLLADFF